MKRVTEGNFDALFYSAVNEWGINVTHMQMFSFNCKFFRFGTHFPSVDVKTRVREGICFNINTWSNGSVSCLHDHIFNPTPGPFSVSHELLCKYHGDGGQLHQHTYRSHLSHLIYDFTLNWEHLSGTELDTCSSVSIIYMPITKCQSVFLLHSVKTILYDLLYDSSVFKWSRCSCNELS